MYVYYICCKLEINSLSYIYIYSCTAYIGGMLLYKGGKPTIQTNRWCCIYSSLLIFVSVHTHISIINGNVLNIVTTNYSIVFKYALKRRVWIWWSEVHQCIQNPQLVKWMPQPSSKIDVQQKSAKWTLCTWCEVVFICLNRDAHLIRTSINSFDNWSFWNDIKPIIGNVYGSYFI